MPLRWIDGHDEAFASWCQSLLQSPHPDDQQVVQKMLDIHDELEEHPLAQIAWAWCQRPGPLALSPQRFIYPSVSARVGGAGIIRVSYPLPPALAPWPGARVVGETDSPEAAIPMIAEAFARLCAAYAGFEPSGRPDQTD